MGYRIGFDRIRVQIEAEISVISDRLLDRITMINERLPTLLVTGILIIGVIPKQTTSKKTSDGECKTRRKRRKLDISCTRELIEGGDIGKPFPRKPRNPNQLQHPADVFEVRGDGKNNNV